ncbi:MAG: flagellar export chaperone FliS [Gammaproteobacteria bacterium]|nr:flagellar export chaperone FliS [Gammaproteobacteria bacterium]
MYAMNQRAAVDFYNQVGVQSNVASASAHRLVQMLMQGALDRIAMAKGALRNHDITSKGESISQSMAIIDGLRNSLDMDSGQEIAENLDALYVYMNRRLLEANIKNDIQMLDEVSGLLTSIKEAWDSIG